MNNSINTPSKIKLDKANRKILLSIMEEHNLTAAQLAEAVGYSPESIRAFTMPDRSSTRAKTVNDRFIKLLLLSLPEFLRNRNPA